METGPRFMVSSDGLELGIEASTPDLYGKLHNHCATDASRQRLETSADNEAGKIVKTHNLK